jgi:activator of 2-hydroxyglutaryl-CoA dehydratase/predicted nucleotide-binding protein (sugar kinase/HSP70/actin superfamily)
MHEGSSAGRWVGIDLGAETIKIVEVAREGERIVWTRRRLVEHGKEPARALRAALGDWGWDDVSGACAVGRTSRLVSLTTVPTKQAQSAGARLLLGDGEATVVSIGAHGFSVLELRDSGIEVLRENSRCSQGTGNFLRQLVERFGLDIETASAMCQDVATPALLSGRCPVILKTDMTHLANKGEARESILAGLYDAVCENVQVLIKPAVSPKRVMLIGGVSRSKRVRDHFARFLERNGMHLVPMDGDDAVFVEALGAAVLACERPGGVPSIDRLVAPREPSQLARIAPLASCLPRVTRLKRPPLPSSSADGREVILGFDIGSTGSKAVVIDRSTRDVLWEGYLDTGGDPVGAAQSLVRALLASPARGARVVAFGATGSGREIVGSLLSSSYGAGRVYVLNEIAAHAEGALYCDSSVDTIFEIGGQDAKYIRLSEGRVVDAAMNEACSAGTGSFIAEQGRKFSGIDSVVQLGEEALRSEGGVSLGQHCSVFMAEIIDEAVAGGVDSRSVIAGIYDSVIQNYLHRVKGSRSVGQVVFCQGMPFASDALAAAVARETGSRVIVPPNPGTVGALGIALLTRKGVSNDLTGAVDLERLLGAKVTRRDTFICKSKKGCGEPGNKCRIDRVATVVAGDAGRFTWGGSCSLWDQGTGKKKLPDLAPDPFVEREQLVAAIVERVTRERGKPRVALTDEFSLKGHFPFFATFLYELGFDVVYEKSAGARTLKRGIEEANVPWCAPMQLYHGLVGAMSERSADYMLVPMMRELPRVGEERCAVACPIVQASPDVLRLDLEGRAAAPGVARPKLVTPVVDFGQEGLESLAFLKSCQRVAADLGAVGVGWWRAYQVAKGVQVAFEDQCLAIGRRALDFCRASGVVPVVVMGRPYTIYNAVLNSNVPPLLREQGAIAIPIDCYPTGQDVPTFEGIYWGHGQRNLRAAHQVRRTDGIYAIWCSNYSCGPDSFNLHFFAHAMAGKPFAVIETDGHSGDAGTKTRIEAFLHCVREDLARARGEARSENDLARLTRNSHDMNAIRRRRERLLIPRMGEAAEAVAACLRGVGVDAEVLPLSDREALRTGRRHTSGKECVPMTITLGSLLNRLEREKDGARRFAFFMPTADGPCRFGVYNVLHRIVLEREGWRDRVNIWSPGDDDYFAGIPAGFSALVMTGFAAYDVLEAALLDARPAESRPGVANAIFARYRQELFARLEAAGSGDLSIGGALLQVTSGRLFGCASILRRAAAELAAVKRDVQMPTVLVVGEIYVRCDPFANGFIIAELEKRGFRVRFAPFTEWLEYSDYISRALGKKKGLSAVLSSRVQSSILSRTYAIAAAELGWRERTTVRATLDAARPYVREDLCGEAVLTVGGPVHEWREGLIDGVVSVGPLECMPNKIAEAQFFHVAEREGLASLTLALNGDPVDPDVLDAFAFEVHERARRHAAGSSAQPPRSKRRLRVVAQSEDC